MAYHHADFHPVPTRPALAGPGGGPTGPRVPVAMPCPAGETAPLPNIPNQKIEIAPPPFPEEVPAPRPSAKNSDDRVTGQPDGTGLASGTRSWVFAGSGLRREPTIVQARRPDAPAGKVRR